MEPKAAPSTLVKSVAYSAGSLLAESLVFPLDTIKVRQSTNVGENDAFNNFGSTVMYILENEGASGFFHGLTARLGFSTFNNYLLAFSQSELKNKFRQVTDRVPSVSENTILDFLSSCVARTICMPVEILTVLHQATPNSPGFFALGYAILKKDGLKGLWKGWGITMLLGLNPALTFLFTGMVEEKFDEHRDMRNSKHFSRCTYFFFTFFFAQSLK